MMMDSLVQTKIAQACEDCSWLVSPRQTDRAMPRHEQKRRGRGLFDQSSDSTLCLDFRHVKNQSTIGAHHYRILSQLLRTTSQPLSGHALSIRLNGRDFFRYHVQRGKARHLDDSCFQMLFQCLSLENVLYVINCLLLEQRVLVHSSVRKLRFVYY